MTTIDTNADLAPRRFPRAPLYAAFGFVGFAIAAAAFGQFTGIGTVKMQLGKPVAIRDITLTRMDDQSIRVIDLATGAQLADFAEGKGGFVRGALRGLERMRQVAEVPQTTPYRIIRWEGGAVSLSDTGTGERLYLHAFGPDNVASFEALLDAPIRSED